MSFAQIVMRRVVARLLGVQLALAIIVAFVFWLVQDINSSMASLYGSSITLLSTMLMAWRINLAGAVAAKEKQQGYIEIYIGAVQKFILTIVMMAFGMGFLKLDPLVILISFAISQLSFMANKVDTHYSSSE